MTTAEHWLRSATRTMFVGVVMTGGSVSTTVTVKVPVWELPAASVAVLVTMVVPNGKEPGPGRLETVGTEQLSVAVTLKVTVPVVLPGSVETVMFAGRFRVGFSLSRTVTVKLFVDLFRATSVAVQTTGVTPSGKIDPEGGTQVTIAPGTLSRTVTT